jgi:CBS domain containing-hemolysin-like protein
MTNDTDELAWPEDSSVYTLETPAMEFINDYKMIKPMAIDSETKADEMKPVMLNLHMSLISIVNSQGHFLGIVSLDDLSDQNFIRKQAEGFLRSEIEAVDFMTPRKDLLAFDRAEIEHAAINDVIDALKKAVAKNAWCWIAVHTRYGAFLQ